MDNTKNSNILTLTNNNISTSGNNQHLQKNEELLLIKQKVKFTRKRKCIKLQKGQIGFYYFLIIKDI